jgi:hypothetical protein
MGSGGHGDEWAKRGGEDDQVPPPVCFLLSYDEFFIPSLGPSGALDFLRLGGDGPVMGRHVAGLGGLR